MPVGIEIVNSYGTVLINTTDFVLQLRSKQTVTATSGLPRYVELTLTGVDSPIVALRCTTHLAAITKRIRSGSNLTVGITISAVSGSIAVDVFHFDKPITPPSNYGLQLFNDAGVCVYDSLQKSAIAVAVDPASGTWTGNTGRIYALGFYSSYAKYNVWTEGSNGSYEYYVNPARCYGNQVDYQQSYIIESAYDIPGGIAPYGPTSYETGRAGGLILDVTDY